MGRTVEDGSVPDRDERQRISVSLPTEDDSHPAHTIRVARVPVGGVDTDVLVQAFSDRIFIAVTQLDKLGTILSVERDVALGGGETFAVNTLIGRREEPMLELCARRVASSMADGGCNKSLLIAIALRKHEKDSLKEILDTIDAHKVW